MSRLFDPAGMDLVDRVLSACGGGQFLHVGASVEPIVAAYRRRAVPSSAETLPCETIDLEWRLPHADRSFDVVCGYDVFNGLSTPLRRRVIDELLRVTRSAVFLHAAGEARESIERECLQHACRKHPLHQLILPYEGLDWVADPAVVLVERLPDDLTIGKAATELAPTRDLHMDMLREAGRRADAHVGRYMHARPFIRSGDRVLDAACGLGYGSAILAAGTLADRVVGLDIDEWAVRYAADHYGRRGSRVMFDVCDLSTLDRFEPGSFDAVVSFETLEHIEDPDAFLAACRRLLTPAGRLVCSVPNRWVDETGRDPNPHHLHVFDRERLETMCRRHFHVERVFGQTAGGGMQLTNEPRALWPADATSRDAEWWLLAGMTSPTLPTTAPFHHGLLTDPADDCTNVLAFERDYRNPWLVRAMVTIGMRTESPELLDRMATDTLAAADWRSADAGAALCVRLYRCLERSELPAALLLDEVDRYCGATTKTPHVWRWQISLRYALALVWLTQGDMARAIAALEACAQSEAMLFSPLLATKTVGAALLRGWLAVQARDLAAAARWWTLGVAHAERALHRPWSDLMLSRSNPALFGLREATLVVDLASRCATGLHLLPSALDRPGVIASQIFESLAERTSREASRRSALEAELVAVRAQAAAEMDRLRAAVASAEAETARLRERLHAKLLLDDPSATVPAHLRVAIFGAGSGGRQALASLRARGAVIDCIADNDSARHGSTIDGVRVVDPATLPSRAVDVIAVASAPGRTAIFAQLATLGYEIGRQVAAIAPNGH